MNVEQQIYDDNVVVISVSGRMASTEAERMKDVLLFGLNSSRQVVINCRELEYVDSSGLGALISGLQSALSQGGDMRLAQVSAKVRMMLEITRADRLFNVYKTVDEAVASYAITTIGSEEQ